MYYVTLLISDLMFNNSNDSMDFIKLQSMKVNPKNSIHM